METVSKAQDLLLAYNDDFTGFTSSSTMAQPLEPAGSLATAGPPSWATGVLGGAADPDGYYEDFTARLDQFVRRYPRLGGGGRPGGRGQRGDLDWSALVITLDAPDESSDGSDDEAGEDTEDREEGDSEDEDEPQPAAAAAADGTRGGSPLISLSDFIVEADGGTPRRVAPTPQTPLADLGLARGDNVAVSEPQEFEAELEADYELGYGADNGADTGSLYGGAGGRGRPTDARRILLDFDTGPLGDSYDGGAYDRDYGRGRDYGRDYDYAPDHDRDRDRDRDYDYDYADYEGGADSDVGGEMDETAVEYGSFETFRALPLDLNRPEPRGGQPSILDFTVGVEK
jgi:hypothetical protein